MSTAARHISKIQEEILVLRGLACFTCPVRAEVSKHEWMVRPSIPQGERLRSNNITQSVKNRNSFFEIDLKNFIFMIKLKTEAQILSCHTHLYFPFIMDFA